MLMQMMIKTIRFLSVVLVLALGIVSCAKIVYPSGGPMDKTPPQVVEFKPEYRTTGFKDKKIQITFDEFIQLRDLNNNFIISPPTKKKPDIQIRGKSVVVRFDEDLKPNTTYRLFFGNAIVDNNQGNALKNFEYVFSTGDLIDSLALCGRVVNSFDQKPDKKKSSMKME